MRRFLLCAVSLAAVSLLSGCAIGFRGPALHVTTTTAELLGNVASNRPDPGQWWFEYEATEGSLFRNETG